MVRTFVAACIMVLNSSRVLTSPKKLDMRRLDSPVLMALSMSCSGWTLCQCYPPDQQSPLINCNHYDLYKFITQVFQNKVMGHKVNTGNSIVCLIRILFLLLPYSN